MYGAVTILLTHNLGHRDVKALLKYKQLSCSSPSFLEQRWKSTKFCQQFFVWLVYGNLASNGAVFKTTSVISPSSPMVFLYLSKMSKSIKEIVTKTVRVNSSAKKCFITRAPVIPKLDDTIHCRVVSNISSSQVNTTSRQGIKQLGISFGSIFLLYFSFESIWRPHS